MVIDPNRPEQERDLETFYRNFAEPNNLYTRQCMVMAIQVQKEGGGLGGWQGAPLAGDSSRTHMHRLAACPVNVRAACHSFNVLKRSDVFTLYVCRPSGRVEKVVAVLRGHQPCQPRCRRASKSGITEQHTCETYRLCDFCGGALSCSGQVPVVGTMHASLLQAPTLPTTPTRCRRHTRIWTSYSRVRYKARRRRWRAHT